MFRFTFLSEYSTYWVSEPSSSFSFLLLLHLLVDILVIITFQVGVDTAKVRVSRSAKEEEKAGAEDEVAEEKIIVDEKETIPVLKPSIKADESDAVNAIQVAASFFRLGNLKMLK